MVHQTVCVYEGPPRGDKGVDKGIKVQRGRCCNRLSRGVTLVAPQRPSRGEGEELCLDC